MLDPALSDKERYEKLGLADPDLLKPDPDNFSRLLDDKSIDVATGELIGRFITEERDSAKRHKQFYEEHFLGKPAPPPASSSAASQDPYARISYLKQLRFIAKAEHGGDVVYSKWAAV